jgi:hypothetical protein
MGLTAGHSQPPHIGRRSRDESFEFRVKPAADSNQQSAISAQQSAVSRKQSAGTSQQERGEAETLNFKL